MRHRALERSWRAAGAAFGLIVCVAAQVRADPDRDRRLFVAAHRCEVVERLRMIGASPARDDRYVVIELRRAPQAYVQCLFQNHDRELLCEAASGFYASRAGEPWTLRLSPGALAALARLGFATGETQGNYQRRLPMRSSGDRETAAELMLNALHDGYGARVASPLVWHAPLADDRRVAIDCAPRG